MLLASLNGAAIHYPAPQSRNGVTLDPFFCFTQYPPSIISTQPLSLPKAYLALCPVAAIFTLCPTEDQLPAPGGFIFIFPGSSPCGFSKTQTWLSLLIYASLVNCVPVKELRSCTQVPTTATLFGNRVFGDDQDEIIRMEHNPILLFSSEKGEMWAQKCAFRQKPEWCHYKQGWQKDAWKPSGTRTDDRN